MGGPLIIFVGLIYAAIAVSFYLKGNTGMCIAFIGYAFANIGLAMEAYK